MSVRVEKLNAPAASLFSLTVLGIVSTATGLLYRLWQRPSTMVMSEEWLSDRARIESIRGSD